VNQINNELGVRQADAHAWVEIWLKDRGWVRVDPTAFRIVDAATGDTLELRGDMRPFGQQTFRPLQHSSKPGELWVAIPDSEKNATDVGTIDTRTFTFKPLLRVPKIKFDSMGMWVDEPREKIYFVYRGHLLSLPLKSEVPPPKPTTPQPRPPTRSH